MLPGLSDELVAAGAVDVNLGRDLAWHNAGDWRARYDSALSILAMSRPLLESRVAARVKALPNVTNSDGTRTVGLSGDDSGVTGVIVCRPGEGEPRRVIEADLVVDASGRGSTASKWLGELGFASPEAELSGASVRYASATFPCWGRDPHWQALIVSGKRARRSGLIFPIEGERWLVTLPGFFDEPMP